MPPEQAMTYAGAGVNYTPIDAFKRAAQEAARTTSGNIRRLWRDETRVFEPSRGESAFLLEEADRFTAHVEEGLGTKNLVADAMYKLLEGRPFYDLIGRSLVATAVNDLLTVGAMPLTFLPHVAAGSSDWFNDERRYLSLIQGIQEGCNDAGCVWGGGETPVLRGLVTPESVVLAGSAAGIVKPKKDLLDGSRIEHGDAIVFVESNGIHDNGLTLARNIADRLPNGYLTELPGGLLYGTELLKPTFIYARLLEHTRGQGIDVHYVVNITGHGWRKLMRASGQFAYVIDRLPPEKAIFAFMQEHGQISDSEMYGTFNMGAGFAIYLPRAQADQLVGIAHQLGFRAFVAGHVEKAETKRVVIRPKNIEFEADTLAVR